MSPLVNDDKARLYHILSIFVFVMHNVYKVIMHVFDKRNMFKVNLIQQQ